MSLLGSYHVRAAPVVRQETKIGSARIEATATPTASASPSLEAPLTLTAMPTAGLLPSQEATATATTVATLPSAQLIWSEPINLSRSGAASEPMLLRNEGGDWQLFWMDQFDGLITTRRNADQWSTPATIPLFISRLEPDGETTRLPVKEKPDLLMDSRGTVHALWLGTAKEGEEELTQVLYYSVGTPVPGGAIAWSEPSVVAKSALVWDLVEDAAGRLHLLYIRPTQNQDGPAGVYYSRRTEDEGFFWLEPQLLYENIYFRPLREEEAAVQLASDEGLNLHAMWKHPQFETSFYARRVNDEQTWKAASGGSSPEEIGNLPTGAKKAQVVAGTSGQVLRLSLLGSSCSFYQQQSSDWGASWGEQIEVLADLNNCPASWRLLMAEDGTILWVGGEGSNQLTLAAWNGSQWSAPKPLSLPSETQDKEQSLRLNSLQIALTGETIAVVGQDEDGDIWFIESQKVLDDWVFAAPPPWSEPLNLYPVQNNQEDKQLLGLPGLPAIAIDKEGNSHVLWSEALAPQLPGTALFYVRWTGSRWTKPLEVLRASGNSSFLEPTEESPQFSPNSGISQAQEPALIAVGEQLHAVWSGGYSGEVHYGRAKIDNTTPSEWSEPQPLPAPASAPSSCCPTIVADAWQRLHVVYAVPLNEERGLYYTRSEDGGTTWSEQEIIFNAEAAGWAQVSHPRLAVDKQGVIHVVWVRAGLSGNFPFNSIYYARSTDDGQSWSNPLSLAGGAYNWPLLAINEDPLQGDNNQVHVLWQEISEISSSSKEGEQWHHRYSEDGGQKWARAEQIPRFAGVEAPANLAANGAGTLYLIGMSASRSAVRTESAKRSELRLLLWKEGEWSSADFFDLNLSSQPGIALALQPAIGQLDVAFRAKEEEQTEEAVWTTSRAVPTVVLTPAATFTPQPTAIPSPTVTPTPEPTATIALPTEPAPESTGQTTSLMLSALLAIVVIASILLVRFVRK